MNKSMSAFTLAALLMAAGYAPAQTRTVAVEAWEVAINQRQPVQKVIETIGVKPGVVIGEVGAGTGRVTVWLAVAVGPAGKIFANDIDARALEHLQKRCQKEGLTNVTTVLGAVEDPRLPRGALDIAFMTNTYHHLEKPVELVRNLLPALKEDGILAIVERDKDRSVHKSEATSQKDFVAQMDQAGFEVIKVDTSMQEDNIYIARPKKAAAR
jgi:tRNA A58 N-methylase Trm61